MTLQKFLTDAADERSSDICSTAKLKKSSLIQISQLNILPQIPAIIARPNTDIFQLYA